MQSVLDAGSLPCLANAISIVGDRIDFGVGVGLVQEVPLNFPFLETLYWTDTIKPSHRIVSRYDIYPATLVNLPVRHYSPYARMVDVFIHCYAYPDGYGSGNTVWVHVQWDLRRPDLSRIIQTIV